MPSALTLRYYQILAGLSAGDRAGLHRYYTGLLSLVGTTTDRLGQQLDRVGLLDGPGTGSRLRDAGRFGRACRRRDRGRQKALVLNTLGIALYRAGRFEESIRRSHEAIVCRGNEGSVYDWAVLAMAHYRLGHHSEGEAGWADWQAVGATSHSRISGWNSSSACSAAKPSRSSSTIRPSRPIHSRGPRFPRFRGHEAAQPISRGWKSPNPHGGFAPIYTIVIIEK